MKKYLISQDLLNEIWSYVQSTKRFCDSDVRIPFEKLDAKKYESILLWHQCQIALLRTLSSLEVWLDQVEEWKKENHSYPSTFNDPQNIILQLKELKEGIKPLTVLFNQNIFPDKGLLTKLYKFIEEWKNTLYLLDYKLDEE